MMEPEKIKKGLDYCSASNGSSYCHVCPYEAKGCGNICIPALTGDALALIQQLEAQVPKWISVEERLPEDNDENVLCVVNGAYRNVRFKEAFLLGTYNASDGWIIDNFPEWETPSVTYWMPLPELPKEDAE